MNQNPEKADTRPGRRTSSLIGIAGAIGFFGIRMTHIARELAAAYDRQLQPYPVVPQEELEEASLPEIPIVIDDPDKAPK